VGSRRARYRHCHSHPDALMVDLTLLHRQITLPLDWANHTPGDN
jgi:hypothetical protein